MTMNEYWTQVLLFLLASYLVGYGTVRAYQEIRKGRNRR